MCNAVAMGMQDDLTKLIISPSPTEIVLFCFILVCQRSKLSVICFQLSSNKCSAKTMDEDVTRLAIHSEEPKIILHGSGN